MLSRSYGTLFYHNLQDVSSLVLHVSKDGTDMARGLGLDSKDLGLDSRGLQGPRSGLQGPSGPLGLAWCPEG